MKNRLLRLGAATAISVTGLNMMASVKPVAASTFNTALKRVKISYLPGKGVRIWTSYNSGRFMGFQAKDGTVWNVVKTAVDKKGNLWYMVGDHEWIQARYTVDLDQNKTTVKTKKAKRKTLTTRIKKKIIHEKARRIVEKTISKKRTAVSQAVTNTSSIVKLARSEVGKNYVWGATGPNSFDCSGLVQYVYQHATGRSLPRTTYDQVKVGKTVSMNNLKAGDLLFWGSTNAPYHVAIYIGNNQYVNAATPDQGVVLQTISSYYYPSIAKRVM